MKTEMPQEVLVDLHERLSRVPWPNEIPGSDWDYDTDLTYMKELVNYWLDDYDWRAEERRLNQFSHYKADVNGLGIRFIHEQGKGPNPTPLLAMYGHLWSILTLYWIIPVPTDPASFGGDPRDALTMVAPSLCGFCLSDPPMEQGFNIRRHADKYHELMVSELGYNRYGV